MTKNISEEKIDDIYEKNKELFILKNIKNLNI